MRSTYRVSNEGESWKVGSPFYVLNEICKNYAWVCYKDYIPKISGWENMMKKKQYIIFVSLLIILVCLGKAEIFCEKTSESNSKKWCNEKIQCMITDYEKEHNCNLEFASEEFENWIQGIWQAKEFVGYDGDTEFPWDGLHGSVYIFCENAWIEDGKPGYKPIYVCCTTTMEEIASEDLLNIEWVDSRYDNCDGTLVVAINSEKDNSFGSAVEEEKMEFIICGESLIMKRSNSYFELEKVGDIQMYEALENVKVK